MLSIYYTTIFQSTFFILFPIKAKYVLQKKILEFVKRIRILDFIEFFGNFLGYLKSSAGPANIIGSNGIFFYHLC